MAIVMLYIVVGLDNRNVTLEESYTKLSAAMDCCRDMLLTHEYQSVTINYKRLDYSHGLTAVLRSGKLHKSVHMSKDAAEIAAKELIELGQMRDDKTVWKVIELPEDEVLS